MIMTFDELVEQIREATGADERRAVRLASAVLTKVTDDTRMGLADVVTLDLANLVIDMCRRSMTKALEIIFQY